MEIVLILGLVVLAVLLTIGEYLYVEGGGGGPRSEHEHQSPARLGERR